MNHLIKILTLAATCLALTGCSTISFLYPLAGDPRDLAADIDIVGTWQTAGDETWTFEKRPEGDYSMTWRDKKETLTLDASVVRISNHLFLDVSTKEDGTAIRGHQFARLQIDVDELSVAWLDGKWMEKKLAGERALSFERPCTDKERRCYVVTARSADLQNFLLRNVVDAKAFPEWETLHRKETR